MEKLLNPEVLVFLVGGLIAIVAIVAYYLNAYGKTRSEVELKQMMLEQGMSVDEIERVLRAGQDLSREDVIQVAQKRSDAAGKDQPAD